MVQSKSFRKPHESEQPGACLVLLSLPFFHRKKKKKDHYVKTLFNWSASRSQLWPKGHIIFGGVLSSSSTLRFWGSRISKARSESAKPLLWKMRFQGRVCLADGGLQSWGAHQGLPSLLHPSALLSGDAASEVTKSESPAEEGGVSAEQFFD